MKRSRCSALLFLALAAIPVFAQPATDQRALFIERVDINVINVEAFVTDADGQAVSDLGEADFELFEDGQPVEISNFYQTQKNTTQDEQFARDRQLVAAGRKAREAAAAPAPAPREVPEDQRLNLVVYVDLYHLRPANRTRVLKELGLFLEDRVYQGDRVLMVAHQRNLQLIHPFTQDLHRIIKGIEQVAGMTTNGQIADAERKRVIWTLKNPDAEARDALDTIRLFVQQQRLETENSMRSLETLLRSLGGLPGRRALLYVSDGLEKQPGLDLYQLYDERYGLGRERSGLEVMRNDLSDLFDRITRVANTYQTTLYTLQARGSAGTNRGSAENGDLATGIAGTLQASNLRDFAEQEPLIDLAQETGGSSILNTNNFGGALQNLSRDFGNLYSLGYRSKNGGDGKYHRIEVKVKRPGLKVRHRSGYVDKPQDQRVADRAYSSLILGLEANPMGAVVDFAEAKQEGPGKYHLPLMVRIPLRQLTLLPDGDQLKGKLRFYLAVQDPDGAISDVREVPYPIAIAAAGADQLQEKEIGYAVKLAVREGRPTIAIGIWDELAGTETYLLRTLDIGSNAKKPAATTKKPGS